MSTELTTKESQEYRALKRSITKRLKTVGNETQQIGKDLERIRDGKLYRHEYRSFSEFVRLEYGRSARWAYQQLDHIKVLTNIKSLETPKGADASTYSVDSVQNANPGSQNLPVEKQSRELASLPDEEQAEAWEEAQEKAESEGREAPTTEDVKETVRKRKNALGGEYKPTLTAPDPKGFRSPLGQAVRFLDKWASHHKIQNKPKHKAILKHLNAGLEAFDAVMKEVSK